jgi:hypothetical protein
MQSLMMTAKSYASIDGMLREAKWHKEQGSNVIKLEVVKETKEDVTTLVGECLF